MTDFDASAHLKSLAAIEDSNIDLVRAALSLSLACTSVSAGKYLHHAQSATEAVSKRFNELLARGGVDDARTRLAALKHVLSDEYDYRLDRPEAEVLDTSDLARVMERRKGHSIAIAILYCQVARTMGWVLDCLSFPGYTYSRLEHAGERLIFDAGRQCRLMLAPDLRAAIKKAQGPQAELSSAYFEALTNRQILIRLHNAIKLRRIEMGEYAAALVEVQKMQQIDPGEYRLMLDAGVLYAKLNMPVEAIDVLEKYISQAPHGKERNEVMQLLQELRATM